MQEVELPASAYRTHHGLTNLELELNQALFDAPRAAQRLASVTARARVGLIDESGAAVR